MRSLLNASVMLACTAWALSVHADNLNDIYQAAVQNDPVMRAAEAEYRANSEARNIARGALLPQIGLTAGIGYSEAESSAEGTSGNTSLNRSGNEEFQTTQIGLSLSQQVFNLNAWYNFKSSKLLSRQAELALLDQQLDLLRRTTTAYFYVLRAHSNLASSVAEEKAMKQQLDQMQQRYDVGLVAITDVNEAQAAYDLSKVGLLTQQGNLKIAHEGLTILTSYNHESLDTLSDNFPITSPEPADMEQWVSMALENNTTLQSVKTAVETAEYRAKAARSNHLPVITLGANYAKSDSSGEQKDLLTGISGDIDSMDKESKSIGLSLSLPLFSGGTISANRRQAYAQYDMAKENLVSNERVVTQQTRAQFIAAVTNMQTVAARKQAIVSAKSALDAIQAGYNVGTRNIVDVLNAQRNLFAAERDYANSRYDYIISIVDLKYLAGTLTPDDLAALNEWMVAP